MKRVIALGALAVVGALLVAPGSGAAKSNSNCPAGTTNPAYCTPGVTLETPTTKATSGGVTEVTVGCAESGPACKGTLQLVLGGTTVGSSSFSLKPGESADVKAKLSPSARKTLACTGKLKVAVVTVINGKKTTIGHVTIKGKKTACKKHVTHVHTHPGFTG